MKTSLKRMIVYLIIGVILLNLYFVSELYFQYENKQDEQKHSNDIYSNIQKNNELVNQPTYKAKHLGSNNEFLILDWTGRQHIFREQDPIKCKLIIINIDNYREVILVLQEEIFELLTIKIKGSLYLFKKKINSISLF